MAGPRVAGETTSDRIDELLAWLLRRAGLDAGAYRAAPLQRRLGACLRALHASSPAHARKLVEDHPERMESALSAVLLGVSSFFRDEALFQWLGTQGLAMLAQSRKPLAVWSAACSDGAELYSVAILLAEAGLLHGCHLLGTDCRADAVRRARAGIYERNAVEEIDEVLVGRYFTPCRAQKDRPAAQRVRVMDALCTRATFHELDLLTGSWPSPAQASATACPTGEEARWDLILWRNMAIYLRPAAAAQIWHRLADSLRIGGLLITGKAERPESTRALGRLGPCVYRKRGE